ncbi:MAG: sodium:solute symporter family protein [Pseudomonadales bacterium]|nr:sodium:solute symporter family protein [Pseudomonadales bacterium]MDP6471287.1 sodium:solute symporter family protein [Pseudomonadales bacterium]MDP6825524.1 sodium:solute symporter family protein [Pseudomonadales bacterium]MDP6971586.1 sodium:solute symporter family protein [Pseudomonadales bacterium]
MSGTMQLGVEAFVAMGLYLAATLGIGYAASRRRLAHTPGDFFLGGKMTGPLVLFFTMQATQYSGNAFFGFTGMGYRSGAIWILAIPLIGLIITAQLSFAPRLYVLSKQYHYLTPADYYAHRYGGSAIRIVVAVLTIVSMFPYLMIQAEATGHAVVALSSGVLPFWSGVVFVSLVMAVYISIGGWRGVVWTDALQGLLLTLAMLAATLAILELAGGLGSAIDILDRIQPVLLAAPGDIESLTSQWLSLLIVSAIGFAMYPQAIQRIYAARSERALKLSFTAMLCVPFLLGGCTLLIGLSGAALHPGLEGTASDQVFGFLLADLLGQHHWLVVFVLCGLLAAIMSTSSSVVLTLSSIFTRDLYQASVRPQAHARELAIAGRVFTLVILLLVVLASFSSTTTLWRLTEIKIEFLMQLFPPMILGLYWRRMSRAPAIAGMLSGSAVVLAMIVSGHARWWLFQAGLYGFLVNLMVCAIGAWRVNPNREEASRVEERFFAPFRG